MHHEAHLLPSWLPSAVQVLPVSSTYLRYLAGVLRSGPHSTQHPPGRLTTHRNSSRCGGVGLAVRPGFRIVAHAECESRKSRIKDGVRAARQRDRQPMDRAEVKRSVRDGEVASTFPNNNHELSPTRNCPSSEQDAQVSRGCETTALLPGGQV